VVSAVDDINLKTQQLQWLRRFFMAIIPSFSKWSFRSSDVKTPSVQKTDSIRLKVKCRHSEPEPLYPSASKRRHSKKSTGIKTPSLQKMSKQ
jgi:hypothetical protein